jgi:nucleotide-binding universal stress UspA family protein
VKKILVGTDTSASADVAVREAARLASVDDAELLVLHVRSDASARDAVDPKKSADPNGYLADMALRFPALRIRSWAESVPNIVLRHAPCSVMIVDTRAAQ